LEVVHELLIGTKIGDLERRNGPYFALFHRIRVRCRRKKFTFAISSDEFLVSASIAM